MTLAPDSDLGERLVTTDVGPLTSEEVARGAGRVDLRCAGGIAAAAGLIDAAALFLNGAKC